MRRTSCSQQESLSYTKSSVPVKHLYLFQTLTLVSEITKGTSAKVDYDTCDTAGLAIGQVAELCNLISGTV